MEAKMPSETEDRAEDPGSKTKGQPDAALQPDFPPGGQTPGPTALWETLERGSFWIPAVGSQEPGWTTEALNLLPLFLKVGILNFWNCKKDDTALWGPFWDDWKLELVVLISSRVVSDWLLRGRVLCYLIKRAHRLISRVRMDLERMDSWLWVLSPFS